MSLDTKSVRGMFGPVTAPDGRGMLDPSLAQRKGGGGRERKLVDEEALPAEYKEAVDADHFVVYGRASVEQVDADGQVVDVDALQDSLSQLLKSGNISRRHKDVRVGEVLPEWKLEEDTAIELEDETLEFAAGDTLTTGANPDVVQEARGGEDPGEDEFWLVADFWADSEIAKDTRVRSMAGDLDGFSVTIYAKETELDDSGAEKVTDLDFHAVTVGSGEAIKNDASRYGIAEFKALFTDDAAHGRVAEAAASTLRHTMLEGLLRKSAEETGFNGELLEAAAKASEKAQTDDVDLKSAAEEAAADADFKADDVINTVSVLNAETKAHDDLEEVLVGVENGDLSADEAIDLLDDGADDGADEPDEEMKEGGSDDEPPEDPEADDGPEDDDEPDFEEKLEEAVEERLDAKLEEAGVVTEDQLDEKLDEQAEQVSEKMESIVDGAVPDAEAIAEKMETGATQDPAGGSGADEVDYGQQIREAAGASGGD